MSIVDEFESVLKKEEPQTIHSGEELESLLKDVEKLGVTIKESYLIPSIDALDQKPYEAFISRVNQGASETSFTVNP